MMAITSLEVLPNEILCQIFEHLGPKWRIVCRHVCQRWHHLLEMPTKKDWFRFVYEAAGGGHLEVLQWARSQGCPWDEWVCAYAAEGGHLEVLKWARSHGCPWDEWHALHWGSLATGGVANLCSSSTMLQNCKTTITWCLCFSKSSET